MRPKPRRAPPMENPPTFLMKFLKPSSLHKLKGLGKENTSDLTPIESSAMTLSNFTVKDKAVRFSRPMVNGTIYNSTSWHESHRKNNSTVT